MFNFIRRAFAKSKERQKPKVSGKPVYILDALYVGRAVKGRMDVKRRKMVELEVVDPWGSHSVIRTETCPVRVSKDRVVVEGVPSEVLFEHRIKELTNRVEQIRSKLAEIDRDVEKLERALIEGTISEATYLEYRRRYEEWRSRLRKECEETIGIVDNVISHLRQSLEEVAKEREVLEVKVVLGNADEEEVKRRERLKGLTDVIRSALDKLNLMKAQLMSIL